MHDQHERQSKQLFQNYFYHLKNISKIKLLVLKAELEMIIWIIVTVILFILTNQLWIAFRLYRTLGQDF